MTYRRGISLAIAVSALAAYGFTHLPNAVPAVTPPLSSGANTVSLIIEPDAGIAPIAALLRSASSSVDLVMYELEDTGIEQALAADAKRGVAVQVLLNEGYYGTKENTKNDAAYQYLSAHGVAVRWTPAYFALTHEKSFVIDKKEAVIMTMNLTPQYYATGREFALVDMDPRDVEAMESTFDDDWNGRNNAVSNGNALIWSPGSENALIALIDSAQTSLDVYNEEMADAKVTAALVAAAKRGVAVRIDMTYAKEWSRAFIALTTAGASVHTFAADAPLYIHAKVILVDGSRAFLGSENFSVGSLQKNRELGLIVTDPATIASLTRTFESDWSKSVPFISP